MYRNASLASKEWTPKSFTTNTTTSPRTDSFSLWNWSPCPCPTRNGGSPCCLRRCQILNRYFTKWECRTIGKGQSLSGQVETCHHATPPTRIRACYILEEKEDWCCRSSVSPNLCVKCYSWLLHAVTCTRCVLIRIHAYSYASTRYEQDAYSYASMRTHTHPRYTSEMRTC